MNIKITILIFILLHSPLSIADTQPVDFNSCAGEIIASSVLIAKAGYKSNRNISIKRTKRWWTALEVKLKQSGRADFEVQAITQGVIMDAVNRRQKIINNSKKNGASSFKALEDFVEGQIPLLRSCLKAHNKNALMLSKKATIR
jgi:hypothetical protein